jgi:RES domain-containing protein
MTIYRMHRAKRTTLDYIGAMIAGGRWNPIGVPMLYAAAHLSLACLEVLVHIEKGQLPVDYVWSRADLAGTPEILEAASLNEIGSCQAAGAGWAGTAKQLAVRVPSIIVPEEFNILLTPAHADYHRLAWSTPRPFRFDPRLFVTEPLTF